MIRAFMTTTAAFATAVLACSADAEDAASGRSLIQIWGGDAAEVATPLTPELEAATIDLAICLDTSGSMDGLIESAKQKIWAIVNDLALAEPTPRLRVALLTFGNDGHNAESGWVRMDSGLTADLDTISMQLFAQTTNGGTELVGRVLQHAVMQLDWHPSAEGLKLIVVAGNESADQDLETSFRDMCREAISRGIMVNSIYCGNGADDLAPAWREVATLADGQFATIDQDSIVIIETPFDEELSRLSAAVNETYLPCGDAGEWGCGNQVAQDGNAAALNTATIAARAETKAGALYFCAWDLVDMSSQEGFDIEEVEVEDMPEAMQAMTNEERLAYIETMRAERTVINEQIQALAQQRQAFIDEEMRQAGLDDDQGFDAAIRRAIREQGSSRGFEWTDDGC